MSSSLKRAAGLRSSAAASRQRGSRGARTDETTKVARLPDDLRAGHLDVSCAGLRCVRADR